MPLVVALVFILLAATGSPSWSQGAEANGKSEGASSPLPPGEYVVGDVVPRLIEKVPCPVAVMIPVAVHFADLSSAQATAPVEPPARKPRLVYVVQARHDVALRSGERVRPRVTVECDGHAPRIRLDLNAFHTRPAAAAASLGGRVVVEASRVDTVVERASARVAWSPGERPWTWAIPESSAWSKSLQGVSTFRLRFEPDSTGPLAGPVVFEFDLVRPWTDARERCGRSPAPPAEQRAPAAGLPGFGEYVYVEEFPQAIEKPKCPPPVNARGETLEGSVVVQARVSVDGRVDDWKVVKSTPGLDETAVECVRRYRFKPALSNGKLVAVWVAVPVRFSLE